MNTKKMLWSVFAVTLVITVILIAMTQYYVAVALLLGTAVMRHRELWSLITGKRPPPADERVKENNGKAVRNGFIYFAVATAFLMLPVGGVVMRSLHTEHILAILFLSAGLVYMLSYLFYDRAEPVMTLQQISLLKWFLLLIGLSLAAFIIGVFLHNAFAILFDVEEPVFFIIAVIVAPLALAVGLVGSLVLYIMGMAGRHS